MKKQSLIVLVLVIVLLVSFGVTCSATTYYTATSSSSLDVYGYGCDYSGTAGAKVASNGYWEDVTGVKVRVTLYEDGIKVVDTSRTDTSSPYSVTKDGSYSSDDYSNTWKMITTNYVRCGSDTSYTSAGSFEETKSN